MNIAVFCGSSHPKNNIHTNAAQELGRQLATAGHTLVYGGSNLGLMGEVSSAALAAGGHVVGVIPTIFSEEVILSQPVTELIRVRTMAERKERIIAMSDAFIALPGGIGTLDEVSEVMVVNQLGTMRDQDRPNRLEQGKPMFLLNIDGFYNPLVEQLRLISEQGLMRTDGGLHVVGSISECMSLLKDPTLLAHLV